MSQQDYSSLVNVFESYLRDQQPNGSPDSLYEPIRYINDIGGKRVRPVLLLMAYNLWHDDVTDALPAALAIEYFHNFSLMHDDIMDEAPLRRGNETVHTRFGKNAAILSGDAMLIKCFDLLVDTQASVEGGSILKVMTQIALEICEGQQMDMDFEQMDSPTELEYLEMIRKKTACLIGASLKIGALQAGASTDITDKLYAFGENIGLAFQIQDDILDVFGDSTRTGKQQGGDILRGKKNFLYVRTYNTLSEREKIEFIKTYASASSENEINTVLETYRSGNIEDYARNIQQKYFEQAMDCLSDLKSVDTSRLNSLAMDLMYREH